MSAEPRCVGIPVERLTAKAFAPYGTLIEGFPNPPSSELSEFHMVKLDFAVAGTPDLRIARFPVREMVFSRLERHLMMTESRVALGMPAVLIVAGETPLDDRHALPDRASVRAFLMRGDQGVMFRRGAWHGLRCYPTDTRPADFAFITEAESEDELLKIHDLDALRRSHIVDYEKAYGVVFRVIDPAGLLASVSLRP